MSECNRELITVMKCRNISYLRHALRNICETKLKDAAEWPEIGRQQPWEHSRLDWHRDHIKLKPWCWRSKNIVDNHRQRLGDCAGHVEGEGRLCRAHGRRRYLSKSGRDVVKKYIIQHTWKLYKIQWVEFKKIKSEIMVPPKSVYLIWGMHVVYVIDETVNSLRSRKDRFLSIFSDVKVTPVTSSIRVHCWCWSDRFLHTLFYSYTMQKDVINPQPLSFLNDVAR